MKVLLVILLPLLFTFNVNFKSPDTPKTCYYFCYSRTIREPALADQEHILYTGINKMICDENSLQAKAKDWQRFVDNICKSSKGCTSDLNYYPNLKEAEDNLENTINRYSNPSKYQIKKVDFN